MVRVPPASEPASGSVSDQQPSFLPCASGTTILFLLRFVAKFENVIGAQRIMRRNDNAHRTIDARKLLDGDDVFDVAQSRAAIFLGKNHAQQAHFRQLGND